MSTATYAQEADVDFDQRPAEEFMTHFSTQARVSGPSEPQAPEGKMIQEGKTILEQIDDLKAKSVEIDKQTAELVDIATAGAAMKINQGIRDLTQFGATQKLTAIAQQLAPYLPHGTFVVPTSPEAVEPNEPIAHRGTKKKVPRRTKEPAASVTLPPDGLEKPRGWLITTIKEIMAPTDSGHLIHVTRLLAELQKRGYQGDTTTSVIGAMNSAAQRRYFVNAGKNQWYYTPEPQAEGKPKKSKRSK